MARDEGGFVEDFGGLLTEKFFRCFFRRRRRRGRKGRRRRRIRWMESWKYLKFRRLYID